MGWVLKIEEIGEILFAIRNGLPIKVKDLADVSVGRQSRTGIAGFNHRDDIVKGVVLLTQGRDPMTVLGELKARIADFNAHRLPNGLEIESSDLAMAGYSSLMCGSRYRLERAIGSPK